MEIVRQWFRRYFNDPQVVILALLLIAGFAIVLVMGDMLAPVLASVVLAYLLDGVVDRLQRWHIPRIVAVSLVFLFFLVLVVMIFFVLVPRLSQQLTQLFQQLPQMVSMGQAKLLQLPEQYPGFVTEQQVSDIMAGLRMERDGSGLR